MRKYPAHAESLQPVYRFYFRYISGHKSKPAEAGIDFNMYSHSHALLGGIIRNTASLTERINRNYKSCIHSRPDGHIVMIAGQQ